MPVVITAYSDRTFTFVRACLVVLLKLALYMQQDNQ